MPELRMRDALREALREEMLRDPKVFLMGEDIGAYGGSYAVTKGLLDEFGPERVRGGRECREPKGGQQVAQWILLRCRAGMKGEALMLKNTRIVS